MLSPVLTLSFPSKDDEGRLEVEGLYVKGGFVAGGGIDMLALPMLVPVVPASANLLFLFAVDMEGELESNEWEGVRCFTPPNLGSFASGGVAEPSSVSEELFRALPSGLAVCEARGELALSMLVVLDK